VILCSGQYHRIVNALDKHGYETELQATLKSARRLFVRDLKTCVAMGGPDVMLQSRNSRYNNPSLKIAYLFVPKICY